MRIYIITGCAFFLGGCIIAALAFYESYCSRSSHPQKDFEIRSLLAKSAKFAGACILLLVVFTISQMVCRYYNISFVPSFMISVLISLNFLGFCYLFNLKHTSSLDDPAGKKGAKYKNKEFQDKPEQ
jgi:uncharacterized membrane protein